MKPHYIYEIEFPDGMIYVGCTVDVGNRIKQHFQNPCKALKKHMKKTGYTLQDAHFKVHQEVMYKSIGLKKEKGRIMYLHSKGVCLNYYRGKTSKRIATVKINGVAKTVLANGDLVDLKS